MFSMLTGNFEAAHLLLSAGAHVAVRNTRNKTAADLGQLAGAPDSLVQSLREPELVRGVDDTPDDCFFI